MLGHDPRLYRDREEWGDAAIDPEHAPPRVVYLGHGGGYVAALEGIWGVGACAVPLCPTHPDAEWEHVLETALPEVVVCVDAPEEENRLKRLFDPKRVLSLSVDDIGPSSTLPDHHHYSLHPWPAASQRPAMMMFTSGSTGKPKAAVHSFRSLASLMDSLELAWAWTHTDRVLLTLPMHHMHGISTVLTGLGAGAIVEMAPTFDADRVWDRLRSGEVNVFVGVPPMYSKLLEVAPSSKENLRKELRGLRLCVSGSSALPPSVCTAWEELTGVSILERFGTTETGLVLSQPLVSHPQAARTEAELRSATEWVVGERHVGTVGYPLPQVEVEIDPQTGALSIGGPTLFSGYFRDPQSTRDAFSGRNGMYDTGDTATHHSDTELHLLRQEEGAIGEKNSPPTHSPTPKPSSPVRIQGRTKVDILDRSGYKLSALEIEAALLQHPLVGEVAVFGVPDAVDPAKGQQVVAWVAHKVDHHDPIAHLKEWMAEQVAHYKIPQVFHSVDALPRNAMGKVNKSQLAQIHLQAYTKQ